MKKIISCILTLTILLSNVYITGLAITTSNEISAISINDIPLDWEGWYHGFSATRIKRGAEIHINSIKPDGTVMGIFIISPYSEKREDGDVDGSYYFEGKIDFNTSSITFRGNEWIDYPIGVSFFGLFEFRGYFDLEEGVIHGTIAGGGEWEVHTINYSDFDVDWGFTLGENNNSFIHFNEKKEEGFYNESNYELDQNYIKELMGNKNSNNFFNLFKNDDNEYLKDYMFDNWSGVCYGISTTIGLLFNGSIGIDSLSDGDESNYFELPNPWESPKLLNAINYYYLSQVVPKYMLQDVQIVGTASNDYFSEYDTYGMVGYSLNMFLKELINNVKTDGIKRLDCSYKIGDESSSKEIGGHSLIVVGCNYDTKNQLYTLTIYDVNTVKKDNPTGSFSKMVINKDRTEFTIYKPNGRIFINNENYLAMSMSNFEPINDISDLHPSGSAATSNEEEETEPNHAIIDISLDYEFTVTSGDRTMQCSDGKLSGNMTGYNIQSYLRGNRGRFYIEVDNYPDFTITPQAETLDIAIMQDGYYMALEAENFDSAYCNTSDRTLTMRGNDYNYKAFMGVDCMVGENEGGLISLEGNSPCDITVDDEGGCAVITSDGVPFNDITLKSYITTDVYEKTDIPTTESYLFSGEYRGHTLLYGDTNFDGKVTAADSLKVLRKSINIDKFDILKDKLADVNSDGKVNAKDALLIQRYTIGLKNTGAAGTSAE